MLLCFWFRDTTDRKDSLHYNSATNLRAGRLIPAARVEVHVRRQRTPLE